MSDKKQLDIGDLIKDSNVPAPDFAEAGKKAGDFSEEELQQIAAQELSRSPSGMFLLDLINRLDETISSLIGDLAEMHKTLLVYEGIVHFLSKKYGKDFGKEYLGYGIKRVTEVFGEEAADFLKPQAPDDDKKD